MLTSVLKVKIRLPDSGMSVAGSVVWIPRLAGAVALLETDLLIYFLMTIWLSCGVLLVHLIINLIFLARVC